MQVHALRSAALDVPEILAALHTDGHAKQDLEALLKVSAPHIT